MSLQLTINGEPRELPALQPGASLRQVLLTLGLALDRIAVERNGEVAQRALWETVAVQEMDRLEVVHFVGGGLGSGY